MQGKLEPIHAGPDRTHGQNKTRVLVRQHPILSSSCLAELLGFRERT